MNVSILPHPQPDQTVGSIAAWVWLQNVLDSWPDTLKRLFRAKGTVPEVATLVPGGSCYLFEQLAGMGYQTPEQWLDAHTYLPLLRPCVPAGTYAFRRTTALLQTGRPWTFADQDKGQVVFRSQTLYCPKCVKQELRTLRFAYAHRTHQVTGVDVCPTHKTRLLPPRDGYGGPAAPHGLLLACGGDKRSPLDDAWAPRCPGVVAGTLGFSRWIAAVLAGEVPYVPWNVRVAAMLNRLEDGGFLTQHHQPPLQRLVQWLTHTYDPPHIRQYHAQQGSSWYMSCARDAFRKDARVAHTFSILLVLGVLFETPADYLSAATRVAPGVDMRVRIDKELHALWAARHLPRQGATPIRQRAAAQSARGHR